MIEKYLECEICGRTEGDPFVSGDSCPMCDSSLIVSRDALIEWCQMALASLQRGAELMPLNLLGQWLGVRAVIESCPIDTK